MANAANANAQTGLVSANAYAGYMVNSANNLANTKLPNGSVTLAGSLNATGTLTANSYVYITAIDGTGNEGGEIQLSGAGTFTAWSQIGRAHV